MSKQQKITLFVAVLITFSSAWLFLAQESVEQGTTKPDSSAPINSVTVNEPRIPEDNLNSELLKVDFTKIQGNVVDADQNSVGGADILANVLDGVRDSYCGLSIKREFELIEDTAIIESDEAGNFTLLIPESLSLQSICFLFTASKEGYYDFSGSVLWEPSQTSPIKIQLQSNKSISGRVLDPQGNIVENASVQAWHELSGFSQFCKKIKPENLLTTETDSRGRFKLDLEADAIHCLIASHASWASSEPRTVNHNTIERQREQQRIRSQGFSVANDRSEAEKLSDPIELVLQTPLSLSGLIEDNEGGAIPNMQLALKHELNPGTEKYFTTISDETGRFVFTMIDWGEYVLQSRDKNYEISSPVEPIIIDQSTSDLPVEVFTLRYLRGKVVDNRGEALRGVIVSARSPFSTSATSTQVITDNDGRFEIPSHHQSPQVRDMQKIASSLVRGNQSSEGLSNTVCVDIQHPNFARQQRSLILDTGAIDLDIVYLQDAPVQVNGQVVDHRGTPAKLVFRSLAENKNQDVEDFLPTCEDLVYDRRTETNNRGEFTISLDTLGDYEVELESEDYWQKKVRVTVTGGGEELEIRVN